MPRIFATPPNSSIYSKVELSSCNFRDTLSIVKMPEDVSGKFHFTHFRFLGANSNDSIIDRLHRSWRFINAHECVYHHTETSRGITHRVRLHCNPAPRLLRCSSSHF